MAFPNEYAGFTCTWKIKNFSIYAKMLMKQAALSREFETITKPTSPTKWELELSLLPNNTEFYQLVLKQGCWFGKRSTQCECELSFLASDGTSLRYHKVLYADEGSSYPFICADYTVPKSGIYGDKRDIFLPQDTLTIRCRIWQLGMQSEECFICTNVRSESYLWNIKQFSNVQEVTRNKFQLASFQFEVELHRDTLRRNTFVNTQIIKGSYKGFCNLSLTVANNKLEDFELVFSKNFSKRFIDISNNFNGQCLINDTLPIKWEFTAPVDENLSEVTRAIPSPQNPTATVCYRETIHVPPNTLQEGMLRLYQGGHFSDATLSAGDASFPIHKNILSSRSPVFRVMFKSNTRESQTGVVPIQDLEPGTLEQMLVYLYTDVLGYFGWKEASKLYYAADKYDIPTLKDKCLSVLKAELSVDNACDLAVLADTHQDHGLMQFVIDFACDHDEVICSRGWKTLEDTNPRLTTKIFRDLYLKKN